MSDSRPRRFQAPGYRLPVKAKMQTPVQPFKTRTQYHAMLQLFLRFAKAVKVSTNSFSRHRDML
jgi:hypothetical protein